MAPSQSRVKQEQLRKRRNNLIRRVNDFWQLYSIRSWLILEMPNGRLYTYQSQPGLPAPTAAEMVSYGCVIILAQRSDRPSVNGRSRLYIKPLQISTRIRRRSMWWSRHRPPLTSVDGRLRHGTIFSASAV